MPELYPFDYAVIRVVPRVEREEFINVGVIVSCPDRKYLNAGYELKPERLAALDPTLDPALIDQHLEAILAICKGGAQAGPIGKLSPRARFHWLVAPRGPVIQPPPVHTGPPGRRRALASTGSWLRAALLSRPRQSTRASAATAT